MLGIEKRVIFTNSTSTVQIRSELIAEREIKIEILIGKF